MKKIDFKKELKHLYHVSANGLATVDVPKLKFLMIDGTGNPNTSQEFSDAVAALYSVSYTIKFLIKKGKSSIDYGVMPLEGLWWTDDAAQFNAEDKDNWHWTVMIMQPKYVTESIVLEAVEQVKEKKDPPALHKVRFEDFHEGLSAQVLHIGPYAEEGPTITKLHSDIREDGRQLRGKHHEIYLSDPRKSAPQRLKTIIRQPIH